MQSRGPLTDKWIKKLWYIYTMEYYSAIKRNAFESILINMNLEPIIQSELTQKEKDKYGIQKDSTCRAAKEIRHEKKTFGHSGRGVGGTNLESSIETYTLPNVKEIASEMYDAGNLKVVLYDNLMGCHLWGRTESDTTEATQQQQQRGGMEEWEGASRERGYMYTYS